MSKLTFPLLSKQQILQALTSGDAGNVSSDDLENPTPIKVHAILKYFVTNLLNEDPDEESFKQMEAKDMFEHQELHEDSTRNMAYFKAWCAATPHASPARRLERRALGEHGCVVVAAGGEGARARSHAPPSSHPAPCAVTRAPPMSAAQQ